MKIRLLLGAFAICACGTWVGFAQEAKATKVEAPGAKPADKVEAKPEAKGEKSEAKKGRLPANYGKLGLTDPQKTSIYAVQGKYAHQIDDLQKQLDEVKSKRDSEIAAVLTDDQRKILKTITEANKTKPKADAPAAEATKEAEKTAAPAEPAKNAKK